MKLLDNTKEDKNFTFSRTNYILVAVGALILLVGFILLSGGAVENPDDFYPNGDPNQVPEIFNFRRLTLAPIVILFGFAFEIFAILWAPKSNKEEK
ncbi:MAG: DUF3098 domain-containing protein [Bacteroidales bacterium]|nr:DUF3098 domain-containing protein [Bacteroidales bacterium]